MTLVIQKTAGSNLVLKNQSVAATDTNIREVSLLLHGNGTNGSTTITDSSLSPKTVTANGNAQISTAQSKFGGSSIAFDGNGDYCSIATNTDFQLSSGNATIEAWVYPNSLSAIHMLVDMRPSGAGTTGVAIYLNGPTLSVARSRNDVLQTGSTLTASTWHHIAWSRLGSLNYLFLNGVLANTTSNTAEYPSTLVYVGADTMPSPTQYFNGYIDELRITKGVARYTSNFTPPTAPFPDF